MCIKRFFKISVLFILSGTQTGQVYPQVGTDDVDSVPAVKKARSPSLDRIRDNTGTETRKPKTSTQTRTESVLEIPEMAPVDIDIKRLATETVYRSTDNTDKSVIDSKPESSATGDMELPHVTKSVPMTTATDGSIVEAQAGEDIGADEDEQSMISDMEDVITEAESDEAIDMTEEDLSIISDEELEFLYQSGSLQDDEAPDTPGVAETGPDLITGLYDTESEELRMLGEIIKPGEARRLRWDASETFYGGMLETPVHVIRGRKSGLTLCLTAAIHGDELNGVEIVRRLVDGISAEELSGTVIGVPIVNLLGFTRGSRYLPDRRDLNRFFPGNRRGSSASRIANSFIEEIVINCDRLVDLHTGSLNRTNMPQLRANLDNPDVVEFTRHFGSTAVLHSRNIRGNLRTAATNIGIPAVTLELGEPGSLQEKHIEYGVKVIETLLDKLDMVKRRRKWSEPQPVYYSSRWVRVNNGGLLTSTVKVGTKIRQGSTLGIIVNPITSESYKIKSPYNGRVLGKSLNQFMLPGYAAFNIGIATSEKEATLDAQTFECLGTDMAPDQVADEFDCSADGSDEAELPYEERDEMIENIE